LPEEYDGGATINLDLIETQVYKAILISTFISIAAWLTWAPGIFFCRNKGCSFVISDK